MDNLYAVTVRHNIEVAHRLWSLPGKCENIHGHSMWVELEIGGKVDSNGLLDGRDFGDIKRAFRGHLDSTYDHRLLLNEKDPWAVKLHDRAGQIASHLPGLQLFEGDPTTENIARWIGVWAQNELLVTKGMVRVHETHVNAAKYAWWE
jgi:6-pyruvoyltetrahydropterin/6-carboxytetrahydropterin synthase